MPRRSTIAFLNGMAAALLVLGLGRVVGFVNPGGAVWSIVALTAGLAAVVGFGIASLLAFRRIASVQLLAGVAVALILGALYLLPVFRSVAGPVVALMFFPMLLISTGTRLSLAENGVSFLSSGFAIVGVLAGAALVWSSEAPLTPAWGIALASVLLHIAGLIALSAQYDAGRRWHVLGTVAGVTALTSSLLASVMTSELFFVIGSV